MTAEYFERMAAVIQPGPAIELPNLVSNWENRPLHTNPRRRPVVGTIATAAAAARPAAAYHQDHVR